MIYEVYSNGKKSFRWAAKCEKLKDAGYNIFQMLNFPSIMWMTENNLLLQQVWYVIIRL